ncbi:Cytochrome c-type biogenesis protein DsbD [Minicystis rosea]|nr:Cytochrome c-type biogenesis protein DsbD [Minicystis rosea]
MCVVIAACGPPAATVEIAAVGSAKPAAPPSASPVIARPAPAAAKKEIAWISSEREARERARRLGMPFLVWVRADWDAAGLEMERKSWTDARVVQAASSFVALRLDVSEAEGDAELLAQQYGVDMMPMTILFDASGRKVTVLRGYTDAAALAAALSAL